MKCFQPTWNGLNLLAVASNLIAMASKLLEMASNLMACNLVFSDDNHTHRQLRQLHRWTVKQYPTQHVYSGRQLTKPRTQKRNRHLNTPTQLW